ncbi:MAG TPA: tRNA pseudouridine(55) synthase TruB [Gemmatimonadales bacterium]|nr:tRNA pseudouridine(55) synthase TruB [Gemmatimonadales bacterium]
MLIDKPVGWTSHDVVAVVRRQLGLRSVGHAGTLDPFATGLLVVLVGRATRLARFVEAERKVYQTTVEFGVATDTDDATGTVTAQLVPESWPTLQQLAHAASQLEGVQQQRPPAYSAKHVNGKRAYAMARAGEVVELPPVEVMVHALTLQDWSPPHLTLMATVGRGTYIRALARDLGTLVGLPAHCHALRRTAIGPFAVADAVAPEAVTAAVLRSPAAMVGSLPRLTVTAEERRDIGFGRAIAQREAGTGHVALLDAEGALLAVAVAHEGRWQPEVVLEPAA